jgi:hypothetical protein
MEIPNSLSHLSVSLPVATLLMRGIHIASRKHA